MSNRGIVHVLSCRDNHHHLAPRPAPALPHLLLYRWETDRPRPMYMIDLRTTLYSMRSSKTLKSRILVDLPPQTCGSHLQKIFQ